MKEFYSFLRDMKLKLEKEDLGLVVGKNKGLQ